MAEFLRLRYFWLPERRPEAALGLGLDRQEDGFRRCWRRRCPPARQLASSNGRDDSSSAGLRRCLPAPRAAAQTALARSKAGAPGAPAGRHHCGVVRFLIDECLTIDLVSVAGRRAMAPSTPRVP